MDPISAITGITALAGMGMSAAGMFGGRSAASAISNDQNQILQGEEQENNLRQTAMNLSAKRQLIQQSRNTQRARAQGLATAVNQGGQFGSGYAGGQGQAAAQGAWNQLGITQNQQIGNQIFGVDDSIDQLKMSMGTSMTQMSNAQGLMGLGGAITGASGTLGKLGGNMFGSPSGGGTSGTDPTYSSYGYGNT